MAFSTTSMASKSARSPSDHLDAHAFDIKGWLLHAMQLRSLAPSQGSFTGGIHDGFGGRMFAP